MPPGTIVFFHAHPDDETIATGGTMARAAAAGHRVVLVLATLGELGEVEPGFLRPGESLGERREAETRAAARHLGVARVAFLGYRDSGMADTPGNDDPTSFWQADIDEAAARLAQILAEEGAEVLTTYDERGVYGHPDHMQVHRVGRRAGAVVDGVRMYEATADRDHLVELIRKYSGVFQDEAEAAPEELEIGVPIERITTVVDVRAFVGVKRAAMREHASQIGETSWFLTMPDDVFLASFGYEWYIRADGRSDHDTWLFPS